MSYFIKEIFYSLQGEGAQSGRAAVFCRFSGCNLWSGREQERAGAICRFCDTDFRGTDGEGGGVYRTAEELAERIAAAWPEPCHGTLVTPPYVVCTGGEPLLQLDALLIEALHARGFLIAVETNGTRPAPPGLDWITVSPKAGAELNLVVGDELKLIYPQPGAEPELFEPLAFIHRFLQPCDGPNFEENVARAVAYCLAHPQWRLSLQTHKLIGIP